MTATAAPPTGRVRIMRQRQKLRDLELLLLLFAAALSIGALVLVNLGAGGALEPDLFILAGGILVLTLVMHVTMRFVASEADPLILPIATLLTGIGIVGIHRIDLAKGNVGWEAAGVRQIVWATIAIAVAIGILAVMRNHRVLQRFTYVSMFTAAVLLLLPLVPGIGNEVGGARVWIQLGPLNFQPGEIAKLALAVFFAGYLVSRRDSLAVAGRKVLGLQLPRVRDLGPLLVIWLLAMAVIVFQRDLGTAVLYFGLFVVMLYVATGRLSWILIGMSLFVSGALLAASRLEYVQGRFSGWLDAFNDDLYFADTQASFQLVNGLFGLANGGLFGTGLGQGRPDLTPLGESDFIIATLGEELGLVGVFAILGLYLLFVSRGFRIGFAGQDDFGKLLAVGLAFSVALQVFVVIGGVTRVIPLTGLTTPFLAAGGSSLVAQWAIAAILLRISDTIRSQPRVVI